MIEIDLARQLDTAHGPLTLKVTASLTPGDRIALFGASGAGKTTLLRVLAGLLRADAGRVDIAGHEADHRARSRHVAYLSHLPALKADLSAEQNLRFLCGLHGSRSGRRIDDAMARVGLAGHDDALARQLSAGQKKRLSLARLWLSPAPLWLLDEPYANLDLDGIALVNALVSEHLAEGGAALVTTHGAYAAPPVRTRMLQLSNARVDA